VPDLVGVALLAGAGAVELLVAGAIDECGGKARLEAVHERRDDRP
jgi:hypothetical protein